MWVSEFWTNDIVYMIIHTISMSMVCLGKYGQKVDLTLCMRLARYRAQCHFLHIAEYGQKLDKYSHYQPKRL